MACKNPIHLKNPRPNATSAGTHYNVPCGKCHGCLKRKKTEWVARLEQELKYAFSSHFITLTYRPEELPYNVDSDGVLYETLYKKHLQDFIKRLQKRNIYHYARELGISMKLARQIMPTFRHFSCGEYGTQTKRPHYHLVTFNLSPILGKLLDSESAEQEEKDIWKKGLVECVPTQHGKLSYVTKYIIGKDSHIPGQDKPFQMMSPNIGNQYLTEENIHRHRANYDNTIKLDSGTKVALPRYYYNKIFKPAQKEIIALKGERLKWESYDDLRKKYKKLTPNQFQQYLVQLEKEELNKILRQQSKITVD